MNKKIYGFYFVALINNWELIVLEQLEKLFNSDLYVSTEKLFIRIFYNQKSDLIRFNKMIENKNNLIVSNTNINEFEFGTLKLIKEESEKSEFYCYYLHSKGVSKLNNPKINSDSIKSWRNYMEYFLIDKFKDNIKEIDLGFDAVGVKLRRTRLDDERWKKIKFDIINLEQKNILNIDSNTDFYHFSGNFWWSHSKFIKKLPSFDLLDLNERHHAEFWIGYTKGNLKCLHDTHQASYKTIITQNYKI